MVSRNMIVFNYKLTASILSAILPSVFFRLLLRSTNCASISNYNNVNFLVIKVNSIYISLPASVIAALILFFELSIFSFLLCKYKKKKS
ncbi:MAG: hypothetical protein EXX96DRAFT_563704, partial [Benjaminiella poitrasii]